METFNNFQTSIYKELLVFSGYIKFADNKEAIELIKFELGSIRQAFENNAPYPDDYEFLEQFSEIESFPIEEFSNPLTLESISIENLSFLVNILQLLSHTHEETAFQSAVCAPTIPLLNKKVIYFFELNSGSQKEFNIEQYGCPINNESDFDINEEARKWFTGENTARDRYHEYNETQSEDDVYQYAEDTKIDYPTFLMSLLSERFCEKGKKDIT